MALEEVSPPRFTLDYQKELLARIVKHPISVVELALAEIDVEDTGATVLDVADQLVNPEDSDEDANRWQSFIIGAAVAHEGLRTSDLPEDYVEDIFNFMVSDEMNLPIISGNDALDRLDCLFPAVSQGFRSHREFIAHKKPTMEYCQLTYGADLVPRFCLFGLGYAVNAIDEAWNTIRDRQINAIYESATASADWDSLFHQ